MYGMSYSQMINGLTKAQIDVDRKMLADLAVHDKQTFASLVNEARITLSA